jgi:dienelactone hydrolase
MGKIRLRVARRIWPRRLLLLATLSLACVPLWQVGRGVGAGTVYGPYGPEGPRLREQLWLVPGADAKVPLRATVFRPPEEASVGLARASLGGGAQTRRPLVVINHGTDESTREAVAMPVFYWLSKWFVDRGYVVLLPQRRGHGATGGALAEGRDTCASPRHAQAGAAAADDVEAALAYMATQPFVDRSQIVVAGVSTGGWASLALAARNPPGVKLAINFAGGRGGHAYGQPNAVCGADRLIEAAAGYGRTARVPTLWIYAANDSYFAPDLAGAMVAAWRENGGLAEFRLLPARGTEGHEIVGDRAAWDLWGGTLEASLGALAASGRPRVTASH